MASEAISNTSPLLYLYRMDAIDLLSGLCEHDADPSLMIGWAGWDA